MADLKISQLTGATTPLAGTEVLPIVQSGTTKQVSVANLDTYRPAFSAFQNSAQSIPATTDTKLQFQAEEFDTNNNFDSTTNYRFTPTVAGYYQLTGGVRYSSGAATTYLSFLKNGTTSKRTSMPISSDQFYGSVLMYFNGTTDYVEMWVYALGAATCDATASSTYFQGALVRAA